MIAKTLYRKAYCFDLDDTLIKTPAKIHVYRNGVFIKSLTPKDYNFYKHIPEDKLDFTDFMDGEMILNAEKYIVWPVIVSVSNAIKEERSKSEIYILTARDKTLKSYIYEFLKRNGIEIDIEHIITMSDEQSHFDIAEKKRTILTQLKKKYDEIILFDDNPKTIELAASIPGIETKLIENLNEKFVENSDPIDDMGIGLQHSIVNFIKHVNNDMKLNSLDINNIDVQLWVCAKYGRLEFIKYLLDKGADIHKSSDRALRWATKKQHYYIVEFLLNNGADVHAYNEGALLLAEDNKDRKMINLLKKYGAENPDKLIEPIEEKFIENSDPIHDMGIGLFIKRDFKSEDELYDFVADNILYILGINKLPKVFIATNASYCHSAIKSYNGEKIEKYINDYLTADGRKPNKTCTFELAKRLKDNILITTSDVIENGHVLSEKYTKKLNTMNELNELMGAGATPGMGNAVPANVNTIGSGDAWGNTINKKPYTQGGKLKTKRKTTMKKEVKRVEEENTNPYDKVADMMIKRMGEETKSPFKKKKEKGNQNAMVQKKYEHQISTFDEFKNQLNENK
jgi:ankyrin repeat protein